MNKLLILIIAFLVTPSFSGCLEPEDKRTVIEEPGLFDFDIEIPDEDAENILSVNQAFEYIKNK